MKPQEIKDYAKLHELSRYSRIVEGVSTILDWDHETHMPPAAAGIRAEQMKAMAGIIHKSKTNAQFAKALSKLINLKSGKILAKSLEEPQITSLQLWRRDFLKETCLPAKFVEEFAELTSQSISAWRDAKSKNSFSLFSPVLDKIIQMCRKKADYLGYQKTPYDALINLYEPDITTEDISRTFTKLKKSITDLLKKIKNAKKIDNSFLFGSFNTEKQMQFGRTLMDAIGYDEKKGRIDISAHPFSSSCHPTDSRITTRIHPRSLMSSLSAILHECGHSLYEMGLPIEQYGTPLGQPISLGIHESQSRWWETRIGQSKAFWKHFLPSLKSTFPRPLSSIDLDTFYKAINKVEPTFIRVEADEVTYSLHVILRFELEKALIEGTLNVKDIPEAWNAKMKELLDITPINDAEGCLQDIHWSMGAFGYFPTYTLGNIYASQLFTTFERQHPDWEKRISKGEFNFINLWLNQNVHQYGRQYNSQSLIKKITGKDVNSIAYSQYLNKKYTDIYNIHVDS